MAIPQLILARQAVALLAVAKEVYAGVSRLPPDQRAAVAADTARLQELMLLLSGRALTKFGGGRALGSKVGKLVPVANARELTDAEQEELRRLISRLGAIAAIHISDSADRNIGGGARGAMATHAIRYTSRQAGSRLAKYGAQPVGADVEQPLPLTLGPAESAPATGADALLLIRHGLLPCAQAIQLSELAERMRQVDTPALADAVLDQLLTAVRQGLHDAAIQAGVNDADAWAHAGSAAQHAVDEWAARRRSILQGTTGPSTDVSTTREQVETLLIHDVDVRIEPSGDVSFAHGSSCLFVGVEDWNGHPVVQLSLPVLLGADPTHALLMRVATEGTYLFGHLMVVERDGLIDVILTHSLLGDHLDPPELQLAVGLMTEVADEIDDQLASQFGGAVFAAALTPDALVEPGELA
jgi:hypothetical protein